MALLAERLERRQCLHDALTGKRNKHFRAFAEFRAQLENALVQLDEALHDRQTEAGAAFGILVCEGALTEGLHDARDFLAWDAGTCIADAERLSACIVAVDAERDPSALGRELEGIRQQIEADLAHGSLVRPDHRQRLVEI